MESRCLGLLCAAAGEDARTHARTHALDVPRWITHLQPRDHLLPRQPSAAVGIDAVEKHDELLRLLHLEVVKRVAKDLLLKPVEASSLLEFLDDAVVQRRFARRPSGRVDPWVRERG